MNTLPPFTLINYTTGCCVVAPTCLKLNIAGTSTHSVPFESWIVSQRLQTTMVTAWDPHSHTGIVLTRPFCSHLT